MNDDHRDRIFFAGNPWPEGHPIQRFQWSASVRDGMVWFDFHLETIDYDAERDIRLEEDADLPGWQHPIVWNNYHACTLSSNEWHHGGFPVCRLEEYSLERLDGLALTVDPLPIDPKQDWNERVFLVYLLGHDTVADHLIRFRRIAGTDRFDIDWSGKIALTYGGCWDFDHAFRVKLSAVPAPTLTGEEELHSAAG